MVIINYFNELGIILGRCILCIFGSKRKIIEKCLPSTPAKKFHKIHEIEGTFDLSTNLLCVIFLIWPAKQASTKILRAKVSLLRSALNTGMFLTTFLGLSDPKQTSPVRLGWSPKTLAFSKKVREPEHGYFSFPKKHKHN